MIVRILTGVLLVLLAVIVWQRGSVSIAHRAADMAAAAREAAESDRDSARAELAQAQSVITTERANATKANALAAQYEKDKADAQAASDHLVAELRDGNQRLHQRWQASIATSELSATAAAARLTDGGADDRYQSAGRVIGAADACDTQVRALQTFARVCSGGGP
ncbi:endopeptidase [Stenotrophomonas sp.]|uniref:endopeptidase n=1 Tax=Stenotrophomonas sp. TaxID=69392 RepID=UPI0028A8F59B|nr:endopeptidase [Stenotrophomonas sp.]